MIRQKILQQLLEWIECNLEHPISIEDIAQKSGYSRRNIQLLFRNFMHVPLGEYIRKRRLCRAACSCPLISRQGLYLKLTLPADVDILAESDNPTHYADGFHCNARSPLQGYAMPFLHSVSA